MLDPKDNTRKTNCAAGDARLSPLSAPNVQRQTTQQTQEIGTGDAMAAPLVLPKILPSDPAALKQQCRDFYNSVSRQLNATEFAEFSHFLNYGYAADGSAQYSRIVLPKYLLNRNSVQLVLEMVGDCDIDGKVILDVGCGRGGTVSVLSKFFKPASLTGMDLSPVAVSFCRNTHKGPTLSFQEGDAESLPFEDSSFDIITNVESSHSYPLIENFYSEVHRVLRPGGRFLYTDILSTKQIAALDEIQRHLEMKLELERDISNNVLRSCDEIAAFRRPAFQDGNVSESVSDFLGTPGSRFYEAIRSGASRYGIWRFVKSA
ncbi:MAG TPA: methyltransferase domain-containing protein [Candidatus Angelobacter sp.]|jgi:ubiquinone/menaquinone biosynthesis C-methylase UbiE